MPHAVTDDNGSSDGIIHVMSDRLANKIAAGEVVQRPASVAKELVENALDAGASSIEIILRDAGSTLVQVVDDGCGMSAEDARRCFDRHATSKIQSVDDLERIRTLGFRGEALASIAAVSQVELKTKRVEDDAGTLVRIEGGDVAEHRPCAASNGTSVAVRNLFYNVPARRNFLKTPATELKHLTETVQFLALSNPSVGVRLAHNGHEHYDLSAARSDDFFTATRERIVGLFGEDLEDRLVEVQDRAGDFTIRGVVGTPKAHRKTRGEQFLFVNERYVRDRYLSHAVKKAYGDLLPEDKAFPFFALFLQMDPRRVDVNVHPQKAEVKFDDQSGLYGFIRAAVRAALREAQLTPQFSETGAGSGVESSSGSADVSAPSGSPRSFQPRSSGMSSASGSSTGDRGSRRRAAGPSARSTPGEEATRLSPGEQSDALYRPPDTDEAGEVSIVLPDTEAPSEDAPSRPVWGVHDTYLLVPTDHGLMVVDQRAAHIRVLYERALARLRRGEGESQTLLFPRTLELSPGDVQLLDALLPDLRALGFDIERMSGRTVAVRAVPADVSGEDEQPVLEALLEQFKAEQDRVEDERRKHLAKRLAQQSAVERGQPLSNAERRALLQDLFDCEMPYADPSGHATILQLSMEELAKRFEEA
jgi:DNA mismatch repair protein MutL